MACFYIALLWSIDYSKHFTLHVNIHTLMVEASKQSHLLIRNIHTLSYTAKGLQEQPEGVKGILTCRREEPEIELLTP